MGRVLRLTGLLMAAILSCGEDDSTGDTCTETYSRANGYGLENGGMGLTPSEVESACQDDGMPCDSDTFISFEAARCVGEQDGLEAGLEEWRIGLGYHVGFRRPTWSVQNILTIDDSGRGGESRLIDGVDGGILQRSFWDVTGFRVDPMREVGD